MFRTFTNGVITSYSIHYTKLYDGTLAKLAQYIPIIGGGMGKIAGVAGRGIATVGLYEAATVVRNNFV